MNTAESKLAPFQVNVSDDVLKDLRNRLKNTRWAPDLDTKTCSMAQAPLT
jgi:hypothetical protein